MLPKYEKIKQVLIQKARESVDIVSIDLRKSLCSRNERKFKEKSTLNKGCKIRQAGPSKGREEHRYTPATTGPRDCKNSLKI